LQRPECNRRLVVPRYGFGPSAFPALKAECVGRCERRGRPRFDVIPAAVHISSRWGPCRCSPARGLGGRDAGVKPTRTYSRRPLVGLHRHGFTGKPIRGGYSWHRPVPTLGGVQLPFPGSILEHQSGYSSPDPKSCGSSRASASLISGIASKVACSPTAASSSVRENAERSKFVTSGSITKSAG